jgi:CheY-like chemotaxis protein
VVAEVDEMLRRVIGEDVQLTLTLAADAGKVRVDAGQLTQILMNLAANARDAMPDGGRLIVETAPVELDEAYAAAHAGVAPGPYVLVTVTDTGIGMSRETIARVFEPFFTTKGEKGTGLGLPTVYGIVRQSGGHLEIYSEPGLGAAFKIYLPRVEAPPETGVASASDSRGAVARGTESVLLVEDDLALREMTSEVLQDAGYAVTAAATPDEALAAVARGLAPDLLVTDVVMPGMKGPELARRIHALRPGARIVFMSGYTAGTMLDRGMLPEGSVFVEKPFTSERLLRAIRKALEE